MNTLDEIKKRARRITVDEERALFAEYRATKSRDVKTKIMESQYARVFHLARKYALATGSEIEDVISEGMIGLASAIEIHDPEIGEFNTIAHKYISGYILRGLHKFTFGGKKQGSTNYNRKFVDAYEEVLKGADIDEVAKRYKITVNGILSHRNGVSQKLSIDELSEREDAPLQIKSHYDAPDKKIYDDELKAAIEKTLKCISDKQANAIRLSYMHGLRYIDIAALTGSKKSTVNMAIRKGLRTIRRQGGKLLRPYLEG